MPYWLTCALLVCGSGRALPFFWDFPDAGRLWSGRAQVGVHSAKTDWSRRILDFQYMDYDDQAAHHA